MQSANSYLEEILKIQQGNKPIQSKYLDLKKIVEQIAFDLTKNETLQFSNLFSKLSFICNLHKVSTNIHAFRKTARKVEVELYQPKEEEYLTHLQYVAEFVSALYGIMIPAELMYYFPATPYRSYQAIVRKRIKKMRVQVIEIKRDCIICDYDENETNEYITVQINEDGINEKFKSVVDFWIGAQLNLLFVTLDEEGIYHPRFIILEPDYLINVSTIAECFQDYGVTPLHSLKSRFEQTPNSKAIRLGNFANLVVDYFTTEGVENVNFDKIFSEDFKNNPLEYSTCEELVQNEQFKEYYNEALGHYKRIKRVIKEDFKEYDVSLNRALLEPSFLCEQYGIQGRLDILDIHNKSTKIIELKSGSTPFPDDGKKIKENHAVQLFLYYQLISVLQEIEFKEINKQTEGYILYSKAYSSNLRYDKPNLSRVQSILDLRNLLIIQENILRNDEIVTTKQLIQAISPDNFLLRSRLNTKFKEIIQNQIVQFSQPIKLATALEQAYFYSFTNFIAKEQYLAQLGLGQSSTNNGLASLWLNSFEDKIKSYSIIYDLQIIENNIATEKKQIIFKRTNPSNDFISIREGDICVMYLRNNENDTVLSNQVFKCTIQSITKEKIIAYFRYQQPNTHFFDTVGTDCFWALERDFVDSSFGSMYKNIYSFMQSSKSFKDLLLLQRNPINFNDYLYHNNTLSEEQNRILTKALSSKDYFLLNGPPGTGKTSIIINQLVKELYQNTNENILLLAYTNRAVDELCESINNAIIESDQNLAFIRLGNKLTTAEEHQSNLLSEIIKQKEIDYELNNKKFTRKTITEIINNQRVFVSTVASISVKSDILKLKKFDTIIIDEASQILEPQIIGILPKVKRFIMIGDHKQLPAIVLQSPELAKTNSPLLESIGLYNRKNSLFERLYEFCEKNNQINSYDQLTYQGRMHQEIADFPNKFFYDNKLNIAFDLEHLPTTIKNMLSRQRAVLNLKAAANSSFLQQVISTNRMAFFKIDENLALPKTNTQEADLVIQLVQEIICLYQLNGKEFNPKKTIGIIAPFRSQIALIKQKLEAVNIHQHEDITVDTVERFQGSQRDIILYSFAVTHVSQLNSLVNLNDKGNVDRKLNVALTRAKEQMFLIGNINILKKNIIFEQLINYCDYYKKLIEINQ